MGPQFLQPLHFTRLLFFISLLLISACQQLPSTEQTPSVGPAIITKSCQCPTPPTATVTPRACPKVSHVIATAIAKPPKTVPIKTIDDLLIVGRIEYVYILDQQLKMKSRIDTGAGLSSLHALEITEFDRDGKSWVRFTIPATKQAAQIIERPVTRFIEIKELIGPPQRRPVVEIGIRLGVIEELAEVSLTDRSNYIYPVLIGRNFLRDQAIVDVSRKYTFKTKSKPRPSK
ncbi:MAG: hypothetical protein ACJAYG_001322 [Oceanicoccus sp.]|jgi:hypothetical protein